MVAWLHLLNLHFSRGIEAIQHYYHKQSLQYYDTSTTFYITLVCKSAFLMFLLVFDILELVGVDFDGLEAWRRW